MRKIKKAIVNISSLFIVIPTWRHKYKNFMMNFSFAELLGLLQFRSASVRDNSVLLMEFNPFHGEVIGAMIPYFKEMGYNIDIVINKEVLNEAPFCRQDMTGIRIFKSGTFLAESFIKELKDKKYKHIFCMSGMCWVVPRFTEGLAKIFAEYEIPVFIVEHELSWIHEHQEDKLLETNRLLVLGKFDKGVFVNPHNFGKTDISKKNEETVFIVVGNINNVCKNFNLLPKTIESLANKGKKFKVVVIGRGDLSNLPKSIQPYIHITGRLNFPDMFEQMEKADFFLPLLDSKVKEHERYITTGVTGSAQLIYGFKKVPIIEEKFAKFYRFDDRNAVIYQGDLEKAMERAIAMSASDYQKLQDNLAKTANEIQQESFENLRKATSSY